MNALNAYCPRPNLLSQRTILITGAAGALGRSAALAYAQHGANVILLGRTVAKLEAVYDEIERAGGHAAILPVDLAKSDLTHFDNLAATIRQEFGALDGILHCATQLGALAPLPLYDLATWAQVMQVNLHAPYLLTRACLPLLTQSPDATVIFTTSDLAQRGRAYWGAYGVTQFALTGLAQIWADELSANTGVRINTLDPGAVRGGVRARAYPGEEGAHLPEPADVMAAFLYLIGPDSRGTNGQALAAQPLPFVTTR